MVRNDIELSKTTTTTDTILREEEDRRPLTMRALLKSTGTPFAVAGYTQRAVIFFQGDACGSVMHIEKGSVRLAVTAPSGKEAIVGLLGAGAFLGEEAVGGHVVRRQTATAMTATEVLVVAKAQMIRLLRTQQAISDRFIAHILARNTHLEADLTDQLLNSSEQRLARTLLVLAGCGERHPSRYVLPEVSQEIIAEMVGTTRSRVNVFMSKFKKLGFIEEAGGVLQLNPSLLHVVHGGNRGVSNGTPPAIPQALRFDKRRWLQAGR
jgi:CRP/FNR family cyclic AMP-dependent transcriptional regulator